MKRTFLLLISTLMVSVASYAIVSSYYSTIDGKSASGLRDALYTITSVGPTGMDYTKLWTAYQTTDVYPADSTDKAGMIWDMYGNCVFTYSTNQCGNYTSECDCYNREHSLPKSWFNEEKPAYYDLGHIVPTDGKVNSKRSNYAFGEVQNASYTYGNSKLGTPKSITTTNTICGATVTGTSSATVFEPDDQYKGDFARMYMYMAVRYKEMNMAQADGGTIMFNTEDTYYRMTQYTVALLMKWHRQDPVSRKEIDRNNAMESVQGNRNPFIDYPDLAEYLWGNKAGETVSLGTLTGTFDGSLTIGDGSPCEDNAYSVTLLRNGVIETTNVCGNYTLPTAGQEVDACDGWLFRGWVSSDAPFAEGQTSVPEFVTSVSSTSTLYAVYGQSEGGGGSNTETYTFTNQSWNATPSNWESMKNGGGFSNNGVQVTTNTTGASATCPTEYQNISSIVVSYCTNASKGAGSIVMTVDAKDVSQTVTASGGTTARDLAFDFSDTKPSGKPQITVNCTTNSIYICSVTINFEGGGTITYKQQPCTTYAVTLNNGGAAVDGTFTASATTASPGTVVTLVATPNEGYVFSGWIVTEAGGAPVTVNDNSFVMPDANVTVEAQFAELLKYDVRFFSDGNQIGETQSVYQGALPIVPETPTACEGNTFVGWSDIEIPEPQSVMTTVLYRTAAEFSAITSDMTFYAVFAKMTAIDGENNIVDDKLTLESTGLSNATSYTAWSNIVGNSGAVYAGYAMKNNNSIQLNGTKNTGIYTTKTGGLVNKVTVEWQESTSDGRILNVYGANTPYTSIEDLYGDNAGTIIGTIVKGTSTELLVSGSYQYIGLRPQSNVMYLTSVTVSWSTSSGEGTATDYTTSCTSSTVVDDDSGLIEGDLYWSFEGATGTLSITGTGALPEWIASMAPWGSYMEQITRVNIHSGVTYLSSGVFTGCSNITEVTIAESVDSIGSAIFSTNNSPITMYMLRMTPPGIASDAFVNVEGCVYVYCYESAYGAYEDDPAWSEVGACLGFMDDPTPDDPTQQDEQVVISLTETWKFIMLPSSALAGNWSIEDITTNGDVVWAKYDGAKRAAGQSGWTTVDIESSYYKNWGHIVRAQSGSVVLTLKVPAESNTISATINLNKYPATQVENSNWNLIGNPFSANYDIKGLKAAGITAPVHIWNGVGYTTIDPEYDAYTFEPFEAFFIQLPDNAPETINLSPEYIVRDSTGGNGGNTGGNSVADANGTLPGFFSISGDQQVRFSKGNLQYYPSKDVWQFAENQYDYVGEANANISADYDGWIDLFGWGTGSNPTLASQDNEDYSTFTDWGTNAISNGGNVSGLWRTLSNEEWSYICGAKTNDDGSTTIACRPDATSKRGQATVCDVPGYVLLSDDFSLPEGLSFTATPNNWTTNVYSKSEWTLMENAGAVFFPCAGLRRGTTLSNLLSHGYYFANNEVTETAIYSFYFREDFMNPEVHQTKNAGFSVRLVR